MRIILLLLLLLLVDGEFGVFRRVRWGECRASMHAKKKTRAVVSSVNKKTVKKTKKLVEPVVRHAE